MFFKANSIFVPLFLVLFLLSFSLSLKADSVEYVLDNYRQQYEKSIENIDDYVMETDTHTVYYKKAYIDDRPYFRSWTDYDSDDISAASGISDDELFTPEMYETLKKTGVYEGIVDVNNHKAHVIYAENADDLFPEADEIEGEVIKARFYIDTRQWVLRKMEFEIEEEIEGEIRTLKPTVIMDDYRDIEGMLVPFTTLMIIEGISGQLTAEEREEALQGFREMEERLEMMSPDEREMMKKMMGPQLEEYRKMLETDRLEIEHKIKDIRVNVGLSDDLFEE